MDLTNLTGLQWPILAQPGDFPRSPARLYGRRLRRRCGLPFPCARSSPTPPLQVAGSARLSSPVRHRVLHLAGAPLHSLHDLAAWCVSCFSISTALPSAPPSIVAVPWPVASAMVLITLEVPPRHRVNRHRGCSGATPWPGTLVVSTLGINCVPSNVVN